MRKNALRLLLAIVVLIGVNSLPARAGGPLPTPPFPPCQMK